MKKFKHFLSAGIFSFFIFLAFGSMDDDTKTDYKSGKSIISGESSIEGMSSEKSEIQEKLKENAKKDFPDNYTAQEYWVKEQLEAYDYMLTIPDGTIKQKAQKDWPGDYVSQKYLYDEQIKAKQKLK